MHRTVHLLIRHSCASGSLRGTRHPLETNVDQFWSEYARQLATCVRAHSPQHADSAERAADEVAHQMREKVERDGLQSVLLESNSFRMTCKALGIEHSRAGIERYLRPESTHNRSLAQLSVRSLEVPAFDAAAARRWADDWYGGAAYCPRCREHLELSRERCESNDTSTIETWSCHCGHRWKIELRECAALIDADAGLSQWIERYASPEGRRPISLAGAALRHTLARAIKRVCDASFACGEWTSDSDERWSAVYQESEHARVALESLCARLIPASDASSEIAAISA